MIVFDVSIQALAAKSKSYLLDIYPAMHAYSVRKLSKSYSGPLFRIRNTNTNIETDIFPDSSGLFNKQSIIDATPTGNATVLKLYDQSGNGLHLDRVAINEAPNTQRPLIYSSSTGFYVRNGSEGIWLGGESFFRSVATASLPRNDTPKTIVSLFNTPDSGTLRSNCYQYEGGWYSFYFESSYRYAIPPTWIESDRLIFNNNLIANTSYLTSHVSKSNGNQKGFMNSTLLGQAILSNTIQATERFNLGRVPQINTNDTGFFKEFILFDSDMENDLPVIEANIKDFYNL